VRCACNMGRVEARAAAAEHSLAGLTPYHKRLLALLTLATLIEGFDAALTGIAIPGLIRDFGSNAAAVGRAISFISWGALSSFFVLRLADRIGRKPALLLSLAAYGAFSLATSFARDLDAFAWLQLGARLFMIAQLSLAYVMLSEEMPPSLRGRANGLAGTLAGVGAALPPLLLPTFTDAGYGWRGFFVAGSAPLALVPIYALVLRETALFVQTRSAMSPRWRDSLAREQRDVGALVGADLRERLLAVTALWFTLSFWSGGVLVFFFQYVQAERGWTPEMVARLPLGTIPATILGFLGAGFAMDRFGRRPTAMLYLGLSALATVACYQAKQPLVIAAAYCALVALGGLWTVANTLTAELFPTHLRATASGFAGSLLGRLGFVLGPLASGALASQLGATSNAMALLALVNAACIAIVAKWIPETRGARLAG
jgi:MFS family permease